jgi:hypothetical protein
MILFLAGAALLQIHVSTGPKPCPEKRGAPKDTACVGVTAISVGGIGTGARPALRRRERRRVLARAGRARHGAARCAPRTAYCVLRSGTAPGCDESVMA